MPLYSYKCLRCDCVFELLLPMGTNHNEVKCTSCGKAGLERVYAAFNSGKSNSCSSGSCGGCSGCG
ncbi:MAG: zinc ribbon domain-containing protein [Dehalococcoidales bacterium]|nr:zinc ribbon domain-containing protein [Dehalococcoidales bacterium]